jgi:fatty acid desaturase
MTEFAIPTPHEQYIPQTLNAFKAVLLPALLLASFVLANSVGHSALPFAAKWSLIALLATINGIWILGMAVLAHDAVHKVLFKSLFINETAGGILSALGLIPFYANRQFHLTHHRYAHQPELDPEQKMHGRGFMYAYVIGPLVGIFLQHKLFIMNLLTRFTDKQYQGRIIKDALFLSIALAFYGLLVPALGVSLLYSVLPTFLIFPMVFSYRALSDHYGIPAVKTKATVRQEVLEENKANWREELPTKQTKVTGWVVQTHPVIEWVWSNVNYHEVHHKYPYLSYYHLKDVFEHTRNSQPYYVVNGYTQSLLNLRNQPYYSAIRQEKHD